MTLSNLEAGATYEAQVRAVTSEEGEGPWSDTGSGRANRPPRSTEAPNLQPSYTLLWGGDDSVRTLNDKFTDDDGDALTYSASAQYPGVLRVGIEGENSDRLRIHVLNPATSTVTYGVSDGYGGYASKTIDVSGSAEVLTGSELTRSVAENSPAGTAVGDPVPGTPYDDGDDADRRCADLHAERARRRRRTPSPSTRPLARSASSRAPSSTTRPRPPTRGG